MFVKLIDHDDEGYTVKLKVIDTGMGIREKDRERIFELGVRAVSSYTSYIPDESPERAALKKGNKPGSGLGLYMVKNHVESLKGTIDFESEFNHGTKFWVTLPFKVAQNFI